jgi:hypothetical protein
MKIENLEDLEKLLKLCQKMLVHTVVIDGITVQMAVKPTEAKPPAEDEDAVHIDPATGLPFTKEEFEFYQSLNARSN